MVFEVVRCLLCRIYIYWCYFKAVGHAIIVSSGVTKTKQNNKMATKKQTKTNKQTIKNTNKKKKPKHHQTNKQKTNMY
jgi:hypothetical protein